jgi:DNA-binding transcriptional LysR family regulator
MDPCPARMTVSDLPAAPLVSALARDHHGIELRLMTAYSGDLQKQLVLAGHGWTILPGVGIAEDVANGTLSAAPLCEPGIWRSIVLATARSGRTPPAVEAVARELVRQIGLAVDQGSWPSAQTQPPPRGV